MSPKRGLRKTTSSLRNFDKSQCNNEEQIMSPRRSSRKIPSNSKILDKSKCNEKQEEIKFCDIESSTTSKPRPKRLCTAKTYSSIIPEERPKAEILGSLRNRKSNASNVCYIELSSDEDESPLSHAKETEMLNTTSLKSSTQKVYTKAESPQIPIQKQRSMIHNIKSTSVVSKVKISSYIYENSESLKEDDSSYLSCSKPEDDMIEDSTRRSNLQKAREGRNTVTPIGISKRKIACKERNAPDQEQCIEIEKSSRKSPCSSTKSELKRNNTQPSEKANSMKIKNEHEACLITNCLPDDACMDQNDTCKNIEKEGTSLNNVEIIDNDTSNNDSEEYLRKTRRQSARILKGTVNKTIKETSNSESKILVEESEIFKIPEDVQSKLLLKENASEVTENIEGVNYEDQKLSSRELKEDDFRENNDIDCSRTEQLHKLQSVDNEVPVTMEIELPKVEKDQEVNEFTMQQKQHSDQSESETIGKGNENSEQMTNEDRAGDTLSEVEAEDYCKLYDKMYGDSENENDDLVYDEKLENEPDETKNELLFDLERCEKNTACVSEDIDESGSIELFDLTEPENNITVDLEHANKRSDDKKFTTTIIKEAPSISTSYNLSEEKVGHSEQSAFRKSRDVQIKKSPGKAKVEHTRSNEKSPVTNKTFQQMHSKIPGLSYLMCAMNNGNIEIHCIPCDRGVYTGEDILFHLRSRTHLLRIMELQDIPFSEHINKTSKELRDAILEYESTLKPQYLSFLSLPSQISKKRKLTSEVLKKMYNHYAGPSFKINMENQFKVKKTNIIERFHLLKLKNAFEQKESSLPKYQEVVLITTDTKQKDWLNNFAKLDHVSAYIAPLVGLNGFIRKQRNLHSPNTIWLVVTSLTQVKNFSINETICFPKSCSPNTLPKMTLVEFDELSISKSLANSYFDQRTHFQSIMNSFKENMPASTNLLFLPIVPFQIQKFSEIKHEKLHEAYDADTFTYFVDYSTTLTMLNEIPEIFVKMYNFVIDISNLAYFEHPLVTHIKLKSPFNYMETSPKQFLLDWNKRIVSMISSFIDHNITTTHSVTPTTIKNEASKVVATLPMNVKTKSVKGRENLIQIMPVTTIQSSENKAASKKELKSIAIQNTKNTAEELKPFGFDHAVFLGKRCVINKVIKFDGRLKNFSIWEMDEVIQKKEFKRRTDEIKKEYNKVLFLVLVDGLLIGETQTYYHCHMEKCKVPLKVQSVNTIVSSDIFSGLNNMQKIVLEILKNKNWNMKLLPFYPTYVINLSNVSEKIFHIILHAVCPSFAFLASGTKQAWDFALKKLITQWQGHEKYVKFENYSMDSMRLLDWKDPNLVDLKVMSNMEKLWKNCFISFMDNLSSTSSEISGSEDSNKRTENEVEISALTTNKWKSIKELNLEHTKCPEKKINFLKALLNLSMKNKKNEVVKKDIYLIGRKEILNSVSSTASTLKKIPVDFINASITFEILKHNESINTKGVVFFVFDASLLGRPAISNARCKKINCKQELLSLTQNKLEGVDDNLDFVENNIAAVRQLVMKMREWMPTFILPLYPSVAFCHEEEAEIDHNLAHGAFTKPAYIYTGLYNDWEILFKNLRSQWNSLLLENNEVCSSFTDLSHLYIETNLHSYLITEYSEDFSIPWCETSVWMNILSTYVDIINYQSMSSLFCSKSVCPETINSTTTKSVTTSLATVSATRMPVVTVVNGMKSSSTAVYSSSSSIPVLLPTHTSKYSMQSSQASTSKMQDSLPEYSLIHDASAQNLHPSVPVPSNSFDTPSIQTGSYPCFPQPSTSSAEAFSLSCPPYPPHSSLVSCQSGMSSFHAGSFPPQLFSHSSIQQTSFLPQPSVLSGPFLTQKENYPFMSPQSLTFAPTGTSLSVQPASYFSCPPPPLTKTENPSLMSVQSLTSAPTEMPLSVQPALYLSGPPSLPVAKAENSPLMSLKSLTSAPIGIPQVSQPASYLSGHSPLPLTKTENSPLMSIQPLTAVNSTNSESDSLSAEGISDLSVIPLPKTENSSIQPVACQKSSPSINVNSSTTKTTSLTTSSEKSTIKTVDYSITKTASLTTSSEKSTNKPVDSSITKTASLSTSSMKSTIKPFDSSTTKTTSSTTKTTSSTLSSKKSNIKPINFSTTQTTSLTTSSENSTIKPVQPVVVPMPTGSTGIISSVTKSQPPKIKKTFDVEVTGASKCIPFKFFQECANSIETAANVEEKEGKYVLKFKLQTGARLITAKLHKCRIADCTLTATLNSKEVLMDSLTDAQRKFINSIFSSLYKKFSESIINNLKERINEDIDVATFKTFPCKNNCNDSDKCMGYHNVDELRRNPIKYKYSHTQCPSLVDGVCLHGVQCPFSHSLYERMFHPSVFRKMCCPFETTLKVCSRKPICKHVHKGSAEELYQKSWVDGFHQNLWNSFYYLAEAIRGKIGHFGTDFGLILFVSPHFEIISLAERAIREVATNHEVKVVNLDTFKKTLNAGTFDVALCPSSKLSTVQFMTLIKSRQIAALIVDDIECLVNAPPGNIDFFNCLFKLKLNLASSNKVFIMDSLEHTTVKEILSKRLWFKLVNKDEYLSSKMLAVKSDKNDVKMEHLDKQITKISSTSLSPPLTCNLKTKSSSKDNSKSDSLFAKSEIRKRKSSDLNKRDDFKSQKTEFTIRSRRSRSSSITRKSRSSSTSKSKRFSPSSKSRSRSTSKSRSRSTSKSRSRSTSRFRSTSKPRRHRSTSKSRRSRSTSKQRKLRPKSKSIKSSSTSKSRRSRSTSKSRQPSAATKSKRARSTSKSRDSSLRSKQSSPEPKKLKSEDATVFKSTFMSTESSNPSKVEDEVTDKGHFSFKLKPSLQTTSKGCTQEKKHLMPGSKLFMGKTEEHLKSVSLEEIVEKEGRVRNEIEQNFKVYEEFPEMHPQYENIYESFAKKYSTDFPYLDSEQHKDNYWNEYWKVALKNLLEDEIQSQVKELYKGVKIKEENEEKNFSITNTLDLLEEQKDKMGIVGQAIESLINNCRSKGTDTKEALDVFLDAETKILIDMALNKLKNYENKSVYHRLRNCVKKLMEVAEKGQSELSVLDLDSIARSTFGKDAPYTLDFIKTALAYEGIEDCSKETVNDIFLKVCTLHFKMSLD